MSDQLLCSSCGARLRSENQESRYPGSLTEPSGSVGSTPGGSRVLQTQALATDSVPRVRLRDVTAAGTEPPAGPSSGSAEMRGQAQGRPRLEFFGEIARGGMGAVLMGRDIDWAGSSPSRSCSSRHRDEPTRSTGSSRKPRLADNSSTRGRPGLRAGLVRRPPPVLRHEAGPGPYPRRADPFPLRRRRRPAPAS